MIVFVDYLLTDAGFLSSSPEGGGRLLQGSVGLDEQMRLQQQQQQHDFKTHRNVRKIDGPVIPTEYSDPDLQRQSSEFSAILQQATTNVANKRHESTFVMDISPSVVGWIIGRSGIRIKEIQSYTGCKMWVDQDVPNDQPRKIYFHGSKQNIEAAVARVNDLVQTAPILSSNHVVSGKGLTSVIVDCPVSLVGLLIGKRGWTIKKIQAASNAQISINQSVREGLPRKIIVSGDEKSVSTALNLITEVLRDKTLIGSNGDHDGSHQLTMRTISGGGQHGRERDGMSMPVPVPSRDGQSNYDSYDQHGGMDYLGQSQQQPYGHSKGFHHANSRNGSYPSNGTSPPLDQQNRVVSQPFMQGFEGQGHGGQMRRAPGHYPQHQGHQQYPYQQHQNDYAHSNSYSQESSNRLFSNQYGLNQHIGHTQGRKANNQNFGGNTSYGMSRDGLAPHLDYQNQQNYHQQPLPSMTSAELAKYYQREESPNTVEATGGSFNSSIFDFQHRNSQGSVDQSIGENNR
jgi:rRNA processing protein Krr1/Pno1